MKAKLPPGGNIPTYLLTSTYSDIALPNLASMAIRHTCLPVFGGNFQEFSTRHSWDATCRPSFAFVSESKAFGGRLFRDLDIGMFLGAAKVHGFGIRCGCRRERRRHTTTA